MFFNVTGVVIWYIIPSMRQVPLRAAKYMGRTTGRYRWFAVIYVFLFFLLPLVIFGLSLAGWRPLVAVFAPVLFVILLVIIINVLQRKRPLLLPEVVRTWTFLPPWMRSLEPLDGLIKRLLSSCNTAHRWKGAVLQIEDESETDDTEELREMRAPSLTTVYHAYRDVEPIERSEPV